MRAFLRRLRWQHVLPLALLCVLLLATYLVGLKLAHDLAASSATSAAVPTASRTGDTAAAVIEPVSLSLPRSLDDVRLLSQSLSTHLSAHPSSFAWLVLLFGLVYTLKQSFSIPGSVLLNLTAGFIFGIPLGVPLVATLTAAGASGAYALSKALGAESVRSWSLVRERIASLERLIAEEKRAGNLFLYLVIMRVFPFTPNWLLNLAAPVVGVPFPHFFFSVLLGLTPYVFATVSAGDTLRQVSVLAGERAAEAQPLTLSDVMDRWALVKLALLALCLLIPAIIKRKMAKRRVDKEEQQLKLKY